MDSKTSLRNNERDIPDAGPRICYFEDRGYEMRGWGGRQSSYLKVWVIQNFIVYIFYVIYTYNEAKHY